MTKVWRAGEFDPDWPWGHHLFRDEYTDTTPVIVRRVMGAEKEHLICLSDAGAVYALRDSGEVTGFSFGLRVVNTSPPITQTVEQDIEITFDGVKAVFRAEAHLFADGRVIPGGFYLKEPKDD